MRQIINKAGLVLVSVCGLLVLTIVPVGAQKDTADSDNSQSTTEPVPRDATFAEETTPETKDGLRGQALQMLATERQNKKLHTQAERGKACQAHEREVNNRSKKFAANAQKHLDTFNSIFSKVQAFQSSKQLNVPTYDSLVAAAKNKQVSAQAAVDTLKALDVNIDCQATDPASTVATLKTAVANARTSLQDYRKAIKDVVVALKGASTATNAGGN